VGSIPIISSTFGVNFDREKKAGIYCGFFGMTFSNQEKYRIKQAENFYL
jgi:hypothetical protein